MKDTNENLLLPMDDQPAKPVYINEQHNHNCQQFYGPITGCVFAMPGATVNQYPNGTAQAASSSQKNSVEETQPATRNPQLIIDYVMRLYPSHVRQEWQEKYQTLWKSILELPPVACKVYDKGRQQGTTFNRNLVANILHLLAERRVLTINANPTEMAKLLEGDANASVRAKLGEMPEKVIGLAVTELVDATE